VLPAPGAAGRAAVRADRARRLPARGGRASLRALAAPAPWDEAASTPTRDAPPGAPSFDEGN